jgi:hydrogenase expression/formation protein HypD
VELIDKAIHIAKRSDSILCSFGDMIRVPGTSKSLLKAKSEGANVQVVYSPLDAVKFAQNNPQKKVVFFAVGFETTAPANALSVLQAVHLGLKNYFILSSHVLVPPAMEALLLDDETRVHGFLAAGHVCTVMGTKQYLPIVKKFQVPIIVTGFEPVDLLKGLWSCVEQLEKGDANLDNQYSRVVKEEGNRDAQKLINEVFEEVDRSWRGIGILPRSGLGLKKKYRAFDAENNFEFEVNRSTKDNGCLAGMILRGIRKPMECPHFGKSCTPETPFGAPMVSSEGACAAYYNFSNR